MQRPTRRLLLAGLGLATIAAAPPPIRPAIRDPAEGPAPSPTRLAIRNAAGEAASVTFRQGGSYVLPALAHLQHLCRDLRTGQPGPLAPSLVDALAVLQAGFGFPLPLLCAYRSPGHAAPPDAGDATAHRHGAAIDLALGALDGRALLRAAEALATRLPQLRLARGPSHLHLAVTAQAAG